MKLSLMNVLNEIADENQIDTRGLVHRTGPEKNMKKHGMGGVGRSYRFKNGWSASIAQNEMTYGNKNKLWEIMIIDPSGREEVIGHQTPQNLNRIIKMIASTNQMSLDGINTNSF
jgi:hypothetical protein